MQGELKSVVDEKNYWTERLYRTMKQVSKTTGVKRRRCEPLNRVKFVLNNQQHLTNKSKLLATGMLTMSKDALPNRETNKWRPGSGIQSYRGTGPVHQRSLSPSRLERMDYTSNTVSENANFDSQYADPHGTSIFWFFKRFGLGENFGFFNWWGFLKSLYFWEMLSGI